MFLPQILLFDSVAQPFRAEAFSVQPSFSTLAKSNSTGVDRPKIVTETFNRL
jgi:hypothetical protein